MSGAEQQKAWTNDIPVYCAHDKIEKIADVIVRRYVMTTGKTDIRLIRDGKEVDRSEYQVLLEQPEE